MKLTDTDINKVKEMLLQKQKDITEQLNELDRSDPILLDIAEASELGSDAWEAEVHMKTVAMKNQLKSLYEEIKQSIERLQRGTYGICKKCGHAISSQRLSAMPTAAICESCIVN